MFGFRFSARLLLESQFFDSVFSHSCLSVDYFLEQIFLVFIFLAIFLLLFLVVVVSGADVHFMTAFHDFPHVFLQVLRFLHIFSDSSGRGRQFGADCLFVEFFILSSTVFGALGIIFLELNFMHGPEFTFNFQDFPKFVDAFYVYFFLVVNSRVRYANFQFFFMELIFGLADPDFLIFMVSIIDFRIPVGSVVFWWSRPWWRARANRCGAVWPAARPRVACPFVISSVSYLLPCIIWLHHNLCVHICIIIICI